MSRIFVVDQEHRPLMPCTPARARILLKQEKAAILRRFPLVLILREARSKAGTYLGRVAIRARGSFNVTTRWGLITDIAARICCRLQMRDGYLYRKGGRDFLSIA